MNHRPPRLQRYLLGGMLAFAVGLALYALATGPRPSVSNLDPTGADGGKPVPLSSFGEGASIVPDVSADRIAPETGEAAGKVPGIHVQVRWDDGQPASDVVVSLLDWGRDEVIRHRATTDAGGAVDLGDPPSDRYAVVGDRGGYRYVAHIHGTRTEVHLPLARRETIDVVVVDDSGVGLASAQVLLAGAETRGSSVLGATAADGRLAVRGLRPGDRIWASQRGFAPSSAFEIASGRSSLVTLVLGRRAGTIVVTAVDSQGQAVSAGFVHAAPIATPGRDVEVRAYAQWANLGRAGDVELIGLPPGECALTVSVAEYATWTGRVVVPVEGVVDVRATLVRGATVIGMVRDASGQPVVEAVVGLVGVPFRSSTAVDSAGCFILPHVPPGEVMLTARDHLGAAFTQLSVLDGERRECELVLSTGAVLRGRYVDEGGSPIAGLRVALRLAAPGDPPSRDLRTALDGSFAFERCVPAPHLLAAYPAGDPLFPARIDSVLPGPEPVLVVLPRIATLAGSLVGNIMGTEGAVAGAVVRVAPVPVTADSVMVATETDATGAFELGPLAPGEYGLDIRVGSGLCFHAGEFRVDGAQPTSVGSIQVPTVGGLEVTVTGLPEGRGSFRLVRGATTVPLQRRGAKFVAASVPSGSYRLLSDDGAPAFDVDVVIPSGATNEVRLAADGAIGIDMVLFGLARDDLRHYLLELRGGPSGRVLQTKTWKQAAEEVVKTPLVLLPGLYEVRITTSDGLSGRSTLLVDRQPMRHEVHLR